LLTNVIVLKKRHFYTLTGYYRYTGLRQYRSSSDFLTGTREKNNSAAEIFRDSPK